MKEWFDNKNGKDKVFWRDKQGNELTKKEFFKRWKSGIEGITPLTQTNIQVRSTWIMLLGVSLGIVVSLFAFSNMWWVFIILLGALGNTLMQLVSLKQKQKILKEFDSETSFNEKIKDKEVKK